MWMHEKPAKAFTRMEAKSVTAAILHAYNNHSGFMQNCGKLQMFAESANSCTRVRLLHNVYVHACI